MALTKITSEYLPVDLTDAEKLSKGAELVKKIHDRSDAEAKAKSKQTAWKQTDKEVETEINELARCLHAGKEDRPVDVNTVQNWEAVTIEKYRMDTGELIESRPMTPQEKQKTFDHAALATN